MGCPEYNGGLAKELARGGGGGPGGGPGGAPGPGGRVRGQSVDLGGRGGPDELQFVAASEDSAVAAFAQKWRQAALVSYYPPRRTQWQFVFECMVNLTRSF